MAKLSEIRKQVYALTPNVKKREYFVYQLICPMDKKIKWVGITSCLFFRLTTHYYNKDYVHPEKWEWIGILKSKKLIPDIKLLRRFTDKQKALKFERKMINTYFETIFNSNTLHIN